MKRIFLDSSFLLSSAEFNVDWFSEFERLFGRFEVVVLSGVLKELEGLSQGSSKKSRQAKLALLVLEKKKYSLKESRGNVDGALVNLPLKTDLVATQDAELKRRVKARGISVLVLKQKQFVAVV